MTFENAGAGGCPLSEGCEKKRLQTRSLTNTSLERLLVFRLRHRLPSGRLSKVLVAPFGPYGRRPHQGADGPPRWVSSWLVKWLKPIACSLCMEQDHPSARLEHFAIILTNINLELSTPL